MCEVVVGSLYLSLLRLIPGQIAAFEPCDSYIVSSCSRHHAHLGGLIHRFPLGLKHLAFQLILGNSGS
jgi:hypothetical protein